MTKPKKPELNPIEEAIGERAKDPTAVEKYKAEYETEPIPQSPEQIPDEPSPQEMVDLEELNRRTEERLLNNDRILDEKLTQEEKRILSQKKPTTPVSKPDLPPQAVTTCSQAYPPQKTEKLTMAELLGQKMNEATKISAEDKELTALRKYILEDGFTVAAVAFHIVTLCAQPMTTPSTTTWAFVDRANIPDMVHALLNQPGYIEGVWPSLKIVMGTNVGNAAWCSGILMTIAFFDTIRMLPMLKELKEIENDS